MRNADPAFRPAAFAATATTLVALLAIAAGGRLPLVDGDSIGPLRDTAAARVVAAAVAAARDLLTSAPPRATIAHPCPIAGPVFVAAHDLPAPITVPSVPRPNLPDVLVHVLDLPPPMC